MHGDRSREYVGCGKTIIFSDFKNKFYKLRVLICRSSWRSKTCLNLDINYCLWQHFFLTLLLHNIYVIPTRKQHLYVYSFLYIFSSGFFFKQSYLIYDIFISSFDIYYREILYRAWSDNILVRNWITNILIWPCKCFKIIVNRNLTITKYIRIQIYKSTILKKLTGYRLLLFSLNWISQSR